MYKKCTVKAVLNCPLNWSKTFLCSFEAYFLTKVHENCIQKVRLLIFFIFLSCYRTGVSTNRFSRAPLFHHFYPKIDANANFDSVFSNIEWFNKKTANTVRFPIIKIRIFIILMLLRWKITDKIDRYSQDE